MRVGSDLVLLFRILNRPKITMWRNLVNFLIKLENFDMKKIEKLTLYEANVHEEDILHKRQLKYIRGGKRCKDNCSFSGLEIGDDCDGDLIINMTQGGYLDKIYCPTSPPDYSARFTLWYAVCNDFPEDENV
jgi:natural product precursor